MKKITLALIIILVIPLALANPNLEIEKIDKGSTIIAELENPAVFDFIIHNKGSEESYELYSLVSVHMTPSTRFVIPNGTKTFEVTANPAKEVREKLGYITFEYQLKGKDSGIFKDKLLLKIISIEEVFEISSSEIDPEKDTIEITIKNKENTNIKNAKIKLDSQFFTDEQTFNLEANGNTTIEVKINKDTKKLSAGSYIIKGEIQVEDAKTKVETITKYLESEDIQTAEESKGIIFKKTTVTKTNTGNTEITAKVEIKKDVISRLFTINSISPTKTERKGFFVYYDWEQTLKPGEILEINSRTNYTFPFIIAIIIILTAFAVKLKTRRAISINKKVSFVKTKSGDLALKVKLKVRSSKEVQNVRITDTLPAMTKLYDKFGIRPDKIDESSRKLTWKIKRLGAGEQKVFSYILYSKLKVVGRFELPHAIATFEHENQTEHVFSNKAFFATEFTK